VEATTPTPPRFTPDEQAFAVWLSHTVIPIAVILIAAPTYGRVPVGFIVPEAVIWVVFTLLVPFFYTPAATLLKLAKRDEYLVDIDALRRRAQPSAFTLAFVLQFVALTFLLADTGGPITSPFAAFVVAYAVFSSLLTTKIWSLSVALLVPTIYFAAMVEIYGFGSVHDRPNRAVYLSVTLLIIWLTVGLAFLSRLSIWRLQSSLDAEADLATLRAAIATQIWTRPAVLTTRLPARRAAAEAALAEYHSDHPELALRVIDGRRLEWLDQKRMADAQALVTAFEPEMASELFAACIGLGDLTQLHCDVPPGDVVAVGSIGDDPILPSQLPIRATTEVVTADLLTDTTRIARGEVAGANIAILLVADAAEWRALPESRTAARSHATSIVILDTENLLHLAGAVAPRRALMNAVREQADLSKTNPFIVQGPAPPIMFFGRADEEAAVTALLHDNSAALLGGRRTGKTSLLQRIERTLLREGWTVKYADLQAVGDWRDFADLISHQWDIDVSTTFSSSLVARVVSELRDQHGPGPLVIMLDEVDRFLTWDQTCSSRVPEAFFRSCRALSQEGAAQFVLAGERVIAGRLWSPDSPHWNFCRPVPVRQLARSDADQLLVRPLDYLGVRLENAGAALDEAWRRTSGHPHLTQTIGLKLVELLNDRDPESRQVLTLTDVATVTATADFRASYIGTYRGQGTPLEKSICNLVAVGATTATQLKARLDARGVPHDIATIQAALRMLDLYGLLNIADDDISFRAEWMPDALREAGESGALDSSLDR
jgi:AAA domain